MAIFQFAMLNYQRVISFAQIWWLWYPSSVLASESNLSKASTPVEEADEKRKIRPEDPAVVAYGPGAVETGRDVGEEDGQTDAAWLQLFYLFSSLLFCLGGLDFLTCA